MRPPVRAPLLVTRCDFCMRRRACASPRFLGLWLCRQCIEGLMPRLTASLAYFRAQGR